jgi:endonuclease YncB( thermonuclease family)
MKKLLLSVVLLLLPAAAWSRPPQRDCGALPSAYDGVAFATDGDTLHGIGFRPGIRLAGIDAPELRDANKGEKPDGMRTRVFVEDLLAKTGHKVHCEPIVWDRYCRIVATCTAGGQDIALQLLKAGLAYGFGLNSSTPETHDQVIARRLGYAKAEQEARHAHAGLWPVWLGQNSPIAPIEGSAKP